MINKELVFSKIVELEGTPKGNLFFKSNDIFFDNLNISWSSKDLLQGYGVTASLADKFNRFYGLIGNEAKIALKKPIVLNSSEIKSLFKVSIQISIQEVSEHTGVDTFKDLPDIVQVVLVSLWRQFGRLAKPEIPALAMVSNMLIRGHIKLAIRYLTDEKGWSSENKKYMPRRLKEAIMLEVLLKDGE
jgi:hypothetical protein